MKGWVSLNREIADHWIWEAEEFSKGQAWVDLILHANHAPKKINIKGNIIFLQRGQQARSQVTLSKRWKWSRDKVKRFLIMLEKDQMIEQKTSQLTSIISICNYSEYQENINSNKSAEKQQTSHQTGSKQVTDNNDNNVNNKKTCQKETLFDGEEEPVLVKSDPIPYKQIAKTFNETCTSLSNVVDVTPKRKSAIKSIWSANEQHQNLEFWKWYFNKVQNTAFLIGESSSGDWSASFDWLINKNNFYKVIENNYK